MTGLRRVPAAPPALPSWSGTPNITVDEGDVGGTNMLSYVVGGNILTDVITLVSGAHPTGFSLPPPGNSRNYDGSQVAGVTGSLVYGVSRSGGPVVNSSTATITVEEPVAAQGPFAIFSENHAVALRTPFVVGNYGGWGASMKHPFTGKVGGWWYKIGGDHAKHDPAHLAINSNIDDSNDGRQEVYKWQATDDDSWRIEGNYYRQVSETPVQGWNGDDGFAMTDGTEIVLMRTTGVLSTLTDPNGPPYATLVQRPTAYNPSTAVWRDLGVNMEPQMQAQNGSWHGFYYAAGNVWIVPCPNSSILIKNGTTFANITFSTADLTIPGAVSTPRWWLTGGFIVGNLLYLYDATNKIMASINLTQLLAWNSGGQPVGMVLNAGVVPEPFTYAGGSWGGGLAYDSDQDVVAMFGSVICVRPRITATPDTWQVFRRCDSFTVQDGSTKVEVPTQRTYYDSDAKGFMSFGSIDFATGKNDERFYVTRINSQPAYIPDIETVEAISLNTLSDVDPGPGIYGGVSGNGIASIFTAWNSSVFAPNFGTMGAIAISGGGDGDYWGNEVYVFPFADTTVSGGLLCEALKWTRLNDPSTAMDGTNGAADPVFNQTWGEHGDGTPAVPHTYDQVEYLPSHSGGGLFGSLIFCTKAIAYRTFNYRSAHRFDLYSRTWSRASTGDSAIPFVDSPSWCWHPRLRRMYGFPSGTSPQNISAFYYLDFVNRTTPGVGLYGSTACTSHDGLRYTCTRYWPSRDVFVQIGRDTGLTQQLKIYDPRTLGSGTVLSLAGDTLPSTIMGMDVVNELDVFYARSTGAGDGQKIYKITPPDINWLTADWVVEEITMAGDAVPDGTVNGMWKRFSYIPSIRSLTWCDSISGSVFAYRPSGT